MATDLLIDPISSADASDGTVVSGATVPGTSAAQAGQGGHVEVAHEQRPQSKATSSKMFADYVQLTKPRIVVMILVTTVGSAFLGAGGLVPATEMLVLLLGTALIAGSAGAANQVWERVIDCEMKRTASRPIPGGRISTLNATLFTALIGIAGTVILSVRFGVYPATAGAMTWLLYVLVYTPMKTRTAWNTTVGAVAGALPVMIGYTAGGGTLAEWSGWLLVGVLVAWQYPHFMAIAWMYRKQYGDAGFCMSTTVDPTGRSAGWQSIAGSIAIAGCGIALCVIPDGVVGAVIGSVLVVLSCYPMLRASLRFAAMPDDGTARTLLRSSLLVLPSVLLIVTLRIFW